MLNNNLCLPINILIIEDIFQKLNMIMISPLLTHGQCTYVYCRAEVANYSSPLDCNTLSSSCIPDHQEYYGIVIFAFLGHYKKCRTQISSFLKSGKKSKDKTSAKRHLH